MTIDESYQFVNFVLNKKQNGYMTPSQFNNLAPIMQRSLINDRVGNIKKYNAAGLPLYGFGQNQKTREELRKLLVKPTATTVTAGVMALPADYDYYDAVSYNGRQVQECTEDEIIELNASLIKPPTTQFPKMVIHSNGVNFYPTTIASVSFSYLRKPATPLWNYTEVNDEPVYAASGGILWSGNSQDFETSEGTHLEICNLILSAVGVSLKLGEVVQYAEMGIQQGK